LNSPNGWSRGSYQCLCRAGFYSARHPTGFNGTIMEVAYEEFRDNISTYYVEAFRCLPCAPGCTHCSSPAPCLATYNWPFRVTLLTFSVLCAIFTVLLALCKYRVASFSWLKLSIDFFFFQICFNTEK
jgi:G protein-coupled receptor 158